jgi:MFS family permease
VNQRFPYKKTFVLGFGFFGISLIWPIFNNYVPVFLRDNFGLSATFIAFIMTWDNYFNLFVQPVVGERSDHTRTRFGRRKPWMMVGAPLAALFFIFIPALNSVAGIMIAILLTNLCMALFRSPTIALLGDLFPAEQRSTANGIINLMGGIGAILAFLVGGLLYSFGQITPFVFGSVVMLAGIALVLVLVREPEKPETVAEEQAEKQSFLTNLKEVVGSSERSGLWILLAIFCWFMGYNALDTWISSFGTAALQITAGRMSILSSSLALSFVIFALPSGLIANRFGRKRVILTGIIGLVLLTLYGLLVSNQIMLLVFLVPAGFFWALINVNSLPTVYDVGGNVRIGALTGMYYMASSLAAIAGPQVVGFLIDATNKNYRVMFIFAALFFILAGLCMLGVKEKRLTGQASGEIQPT